VGAAVLIFLSSAGKRREMEIEMETAVKTERPAS
jgi:hypothetical protein